MSPTTNRRPLRHQKYYIEGADTVILVEQTLFRIHRYFLTRDSSFFEFLNNLSATGDFTKGPGSSDDNPIQLEGALADEFARLVWVFYNPTYSIYDASIEDLTTILKLAHTWKFVQLKEFAIRELNKHEIPPVQKIDIYQKYGADEDDHLRGSFKALAARNEPITIEEGVQLGLVTALRLAQAREEIMRSFSNARRSGNMRSPVNVELDAIICKIFQLSPPSDGDEDYTK